MTTKKTTKPSQEIAKQRAKTQRLAAKRRTDAVCAAIDALQLADEHADGGELSQALGQLERARKSIERAEVVLRSEGRLAG